MIKITKKELKNKIEALGELEHDQKMSIICNLIGCSRISTMCFGYRSCARCSAQIGDSLGSIDTGIREAVIVGHKCPECVKNYEKCDWRDKLYCRDPFSEADRWDDEYEKLPYLQTL